MTPAQRALRAPRPSRTAHWRARALDLAADGRLEYAGYALIAVGLSLLLWSRVSQVDGFYLDEWFYVHGAEYIWDHFPAALNGTIPEWNRGPQRLYSTLLALFWGPLSPSTAYTVSHVINVALLVSGIVPTALLARRLIEAPLMRVLAVALGVAVPWLMIGSHLLTENLAFPLYLWAIYGIVRTAEEPSLGRQAGTIVAIGALGLCRVNLALVVLVLFLAVLAGEIMRRRAERHEPLGRWLLQALRREALVVAAGALVLVGGLVFAARGTSGLGAYGAVDFGTAMDNLFGAQAEATRRTALTYTRGLVVGSFVFPFALGLGVAMAGSAGRAGRRLFIPSLVALAGLVVVIGAVSIHTVGSALEERYVFYGYTPLAVLAVAGVQQAQRLRPWLAAGGALTIWALMAGYQLQGIDAGNFFAAPGGAFWSRVVHHRLLSWEQDIFGWMFITPSGWLLIAAGFGLMLVFLGVTRGRPRLATGVLTGGLALCALAQVLAMDYGFSQELRGTAERPGGIALSPQHDADRETWLDGELANRGSAAVVPGLISPGAPWGGTERISFWNRDLDATVALRWNATVLPVPPGYSVVETELGSDGLVRWPARPEWIAAEQDDPRVQFAGRRVATSPISRFALYRTAPTDRAIWTSVGLQPDGAVVAGEPATMTLDPARAGNPHAVALSLQPADGAARPVRWEIARGRQVVSTGRLRPGQTGRVRLRVPSCAADASCPLVRWTLRGMGPAVGLPIPVFGAPGPPRDVLLKVTAARLL
jgi:hypothetical protein